jgi:hypothetical protein
MIPIARRSLALLEHDETADNELPRFETCMLGVDLGELAL